MKNKDIKDFVNRQLDAWPEAAARHKALDNVAVKRLTVNGTSMSVMYNRSRSISTLANVDSRSIAARKCFLCSGSRPVEQMSVADGDYDICVNPYPVFPGHLTIINRSHVRQEIAGHVADMVHFAQTLEGYTVFYNGPRCGASAPDHCHFQGVPEEYMPLDRKYAFRCIYMVEPEDRIVSQLEEALRALPVTEGDYEPMVNMAVHMLPDGNMEAVIIPRRAHRPRCYERLHVSPGAIDMSGTFIVTSEDDFAALDDEKAVEILEDVAYISRQPSIRVGIMSADDIRYRLIGDYRKENDTFFPEDETCRFELEDVTIGVGFHWQRKEKQVFAGALQLLDLPDSRVAVNVVPVEDYLTSVISSEMSAEASLELLKAHAVISRSWVMAQLERKKSSCACREADSSDDEIMKWYDHDDHEHFDVCADDHCQRYQGVTRITRDEARRAVMSTRGEVLMADGKLCDTRFSKCCGGAFEEFEHCWEPVHHNYLERGRDLMPEQPLPDLRDEAVAHDWIMGRPDAFCAQAGPDTLRQVLNDYDLATKDFYRWSVSYTVEELSELVRRRSGIDFGEIMDLQPLSRGVSGRIDRLRIVGTKAVKVVGKELEIRRWLSPTHLYSSAFVTVKDASGFTLYGAGWGHGVGLCQIGAAVMSERGYDYRQILAHYFKNAELKRIY